MAAKKIAFDQEAREALRIGVKTLARAVKVTLGPRGRCVILEKSFGSPTVGNDGCITIEEGKSLKTEVALVEGMSFDRGYLSPHFVTNMGEMKVVLENAYVFIYEKKLSTVKDIVPLLEKIAQSGKPLLIIAEEVEGEALATLVVNKLRGTLQCAAVKAPGYGDRRKAMLQDIAVLTGGKAITEDLGIGLDSIKIEDLGRVKKVE